TAVRRTAAVARTRVRQWSRNNAHTGALMASASCATSWKTGESSSFVPLLTPIKPKGAGSKNGPRQPHDSICGVVRLAVSTVAINEPNNKPAAVEPGTTEAYRPRLLAGAYSTRKAEAPAYSPEALKPCSSRNTSNRAGAQRPSWAAPGKSPMQTVAPDMIRIDHARA